MLETLIISYTLLLRFILFWLYGIFIILPRLCVIKCTH